MRSLGSVSLPVAIALSLLGGGASASADEPDEKRVPLALCSDDGDVAFLALAEEIRTTSRFVDLVPAPRCEAEVSAPLVGGEGAPLFRGRFELDADGWIVLAISSTTVPGERRASRIPWLASPTRPIEGTIGAQKAHALAMLIDGLILDFRYLALSAPPPQPPARAPECPAPAPQEPRPAAPAQPPKAEIEWGVELAAGVTYLSPDAAAPRIEIGASIGRGRWHAVLDIPAELDSNYRIGDRTFTTFSSGLRLGARFLFVSSARGRLGLELAAAWLESRFRRDLEGAVTRSWPDFGVFVGLFGRARLAGPLGVFLRIGAAIFPTARVTSIADGPEKQVNLLTVPAVAGLDLCF
jgi:hypothetical protein